MVLVLFAYFIRDLQWLQLGLFGPFFLHLIPLAFVKESTRWLLSKGRFEEARRNVTFMARMNGRRVPVLKAQLEAKRNLYYNCTKEVRILCSRQKKYELLENMKNPSYIGQNKYENLEEPSRTSLTRSSYFFNPLVKSYQIFILIQSLSYNWPDLNTFSVSLFFIVCQSWSNFARFLYFYNVLHEKWPDFHTFTMSFSKNDQILIFFQSPSQNWPDFQESADGPKARKCEY